MIPDHKVAEVKAIARVEEVVAHFGPVINKGSSVCSTCPNCKKEKKLTIKPSMQIVKCFSCGFGAKEALGYLMKGQGMSFPDAVRWLADKYNVLLQ